MDACCAAELGQSHKELFDLVRSSEHEVGQFVNEDQQIRHLGRALLVVGAYVLHAGGFERGETVHHLFHQRFKSFDGAFWFNDYGGVEMRNALVWREFHAFGVDHHHS